MPELAAQMKPTKGKGKRGRKPKSEENCPNFYVAASIAQPISGSNRGVTNQAIPQLTNLEGRLQAGRTIFDQHRIHKMPARVQESKLSDDGGDFAPPTDLLGLQFAAFGQQQQLRFPEVTNQARAPTTNYVGDRFLSSSSTIVPSLGDLQVDALEPLSLDTANHDRFVNNASFSLPRGSQPAQDNHSVHHQRHQDEHQGHLESALLAQQRKIIELEDQMKQSQLWMQQQQQQQQQFNRNQVPTQTNFRRQDSLASYGSLDNTAAYQEQLQCSLFVPLMQEPSAFDQSTFSMQQIFAQQQRRLQAQGRPSLAIPTKNSAPALYDNQSGQAAASESAPAQLDGQEGDAFGWNASF